MQKRMILLVAAILVTTLLAVVPGASAAPFAEVSTVETIYGPVTVTNSCDDGIALSMTLDYPHEEAVEISGDEYGYYWGAEVFYFPYGSYMFSLWDITGDAFLIPGVDLSPLNGTYSTPAECFGPPRGDWVFSADNTCKDVGIIGVGTDGLGTDFVYQLVVNETIPAYTLTPPGVDIRFAHDVEWDFALYIVPDEGEAELVDELAHVDGTYAAPEGCDEPPPDPDPFSDDDGSVFEDNIEWLASKGITKGCNPSEGNTKFCPEAVVTRGQMAAFLVRALGLKASLDDPFTDDDGHTFERDIERLAAAGITKGCNPKEGNTKFCPNNPVTRGQMAAFLVRALGYKLGGGSDLFIDDDGHTFETDIDKLGTAGVTKGCNPKEGNTKYCPDNYVTRGQMAAFLYRALKGILGP